MKPDSGFYVAVAGAIPLLLIMILGENKLEFRDESRGGRLAWFGLVAVATLGEIAALRALASPPGGKAWYILASLGLLISIAMLLLLFAWQVVSQIQESKSPMEHPDRWTWISVGGVTLAGTIILGLPLF